MEAMLVSRLGLCFSLTVLSPEGNQSVLKGQLRGILRRADGSFRLFVKPGVWRSDVVGRASLNEQGERVAHAVGLQGPVLNLPLDCVVEVSALGPAGLEERYTWARWQRRLDA